MPLLVSLVQDKDFIALEPCMAALRCFMDELPEAAQESGSKLLADQKWPGCKDKLITASSLSFGEENQDQQPHISKLPAFVLIRVFV